MSHTIAKRIIVCIAFLTTHYAYAEELVTLDTRPGVKQSFILVTPDKPVASVVLFAGGHGNLDLSSGFGVPNIGELDTNFLVRTRDLFAKHNFIVAVIDAPSDRKGKKGMLGGFRDSPEHVEDIDQVIAYLKKKADLPVWLVGTSRGTESAAHIAIHSKQSPHGLVLTSSMSKPNKQGTPVTKMALNEITTPVLVVAHQDDACQKTPPGKASVIIKKLRNSKNAELKTFSGGNRPKSKPCKALSYHGFYGIEKEVVESIAEFIKRNS